MNIEAEIKDINGSVEIKANTTYFDLMQGFDNICIHKEAAKQLIEVLKEWVGDE